MKKGNASGAAYFVYDESGRLLGEYGASGEVIQEIVWFEDIPIASIRIAGSGPQVDVFYIHTDHLNAPARITAPSTNAIVWRWDHDPYGNGVPNEDPDGNAHSLRFNLRFPGQYFDAETGLHYNYFRDYDPTTGRYVQSDPIGLNGGLNTYSYASNNPVLNIDTYGLRDTSLLREVTRIGGATAVLDGPELGPMDLVALLAMGATAAYEICKDNCDDSYANIYRLMEYLAGKFEALLVDKCDLFNLAHSTPNPALPGKCATTTWAGHIKDIEMRQTELRKWIRKAIAWGCPVPPGAWELATRPSPKFPRGWFPGRVR